ncbi:MAG: LacI family transcriptional regulator [Acidimicrobiaceae bacterium]|nr:LacI family transcriptional regulator [Acidimicrobiaceae bacterium]MYE77202.1 LacI family transcriptional regulator [Acidimicrobiaceae bacterium]MYE97761.1 LacI family transcriptional regulator [Acidimicrobiaceae bacterium]MYI54951.1 LacI family transcriptional regulator [Acidimicrobiaceae bacterium]MYJ42786.1 LacI family transcriptional regulator [Acidimicrobiaceae bacterium]
MDTCFPKRFGNTMEGSIVRAESAVKRIRAKDSRRRRADPGTGGTHVRARKRPTLRDVANETGLSVTQTSRALNGRYDVSARTRARVTEAAARIGYTPNLEARRLKMPGTRTNSIGLVLATRSQRFSDPYFGELLAALVDEAARNDCELQLSTPLVHEDPTASYERAVAAQRVDGFVVLRATRDDPRVLYLREENVPFVTFGRIDELGGHPAVNESIDCLRPAVDHLVALGHRRIGCLAEPLEHAIAGRRIASFHRSLADHGIEAEPAHVIPSGFREDAAAEATSQLLDTLDPPSALVAFNDLLAMGALRAAASHGLDVPGDLSIVGFDDIHAARFMSPPLTTLRHSPQTLGRELVTQLLKVIDDPVCADDIYITPELVMRQSTGPAP